jgi:membrane protein
MKHVVWSPSTLWPMIKKSASAWSDDFAPSMGAAIAYYTAFSIAPLLVIVIAIAGLVFGREAASGALYGQISALIGDQGATAVQGLVASASDTGKGVFATIIGVVLLLVGATTVFAELQSDLDRIWKAPAVKKPEGVWGMIRARLLSLGMVVSIGFLLMVSLVVSASLAALGTLWGGFFDDFEWLLQIINFLVSLAVITALFALMYKILPRVKIAWHDVLIGSLFTAILFTIGKLLVGLYLGKSSVVSGFGAAGSLAVLLLWVYYSAQIFLFGAEFTWVYAHDLGSRVGQDQPPTAKDQLVTANDGKGKVGTKGGKDAKAGTGREDSGRDTDASRGRDAAADAGRRHGASTGTARPAMAREALTSAPATGVLGVARRHPGLMTGASLLLGALLSELLTRKTLTGRRKPRPLRELAADLANLRHASALRTPRRRVARFLHRA